MKFVSAFLKPIFLLAVIVLVGSFLLSVVSPKADSLIEEQLAVWGQMDGLIALARDWLNITRY